MSKKPNKGKPVKVYHLVGKLGRWTNQSSHYVHGVPLCHVAAVSIKQAYYLAHKSEWYDGRWGILEMSQGDTWTDYLNNESDTNRFPIGRVRAMSQFELKREQDLIAERDANAKLDSDMDRRLQQPNT